MNNEVTLVCGNKGCVGKSVVAKALVEYYRDLGLQVTLVDGDPEKDVAKAYYKHVAECETFDLTQGVGWAEFTDWICTIDHDRPIVANLPDAVTENTLIALERYKPSVDDLGFDTRALFVVNTLPDGLPLLPRMRRSIKTIYPVKNLFFGQTTEFSVFNKKHGRHYEVIHFPRINPKLMNEVRAADLPFQDVMSARPTGPCNSVLARLEMTQWLQNVFIAFDEVFAG